MAYKYVDSF